MRFAVTALLLLHGAIHLLGFVKWLGLAPVPQLNGRTLLSLSPAAARVFGFRWLTAFLFFVAAAAMHALRQDAWWIPAIGGVLLSQGLIVLAWHDAKSGTLANLMILMPATLAAAHAHFEQQVDREVRELLAGVSVSHTSIVQRDELAPLPTPVRTWLEASGIVGRERARAVRLKQRGLLRTSPDGAWMPAQAEQYFSVSEPGFIWRVDTTMMGLLPISGRDKYFAGKGEMLIKAGSLVNIVHAADEKIDLGAMLRFLGETVWFPSAALSSYIKWEPLDATQAKATMRYAGLTVSASFSFSVEGRVLGIQAERYLGGGTDARLTPWWVHCLEWRTVRGVEIPTRGDVVWKLPGRDFDYYRWEILDAESNSPQLYGGGAANRSTQTLPLSAKF